MTAAVTVAGSPPRPDGTGEVQGTELPGPSISGPGRLPGRHVLNLVLLGLGCSAAWLASVLIGGFLDPGVQIHRVALAAHILALVLSFGAILVLDWVGLLWLLGRREPCSRQWLPGCGRACSRLYASHKPAGGRPCWSGCSTAHCGAGRAPDAGESFGYRAGEKIRLWRFSATGGENLVSSRVPPSSSQRRLL